MISVIICTYEAPRELELVLEALTRQTRLPDEVLVADDGSGPSTERVIHQFRERLACPLHHVWQADRGYRKARIVNEAVRRSQGAHLCFLDGDAFPHRSWLADHVAVANERRVLCGRRVKLGPSVSARLTVDDLRSGMFDRPVRSLWSSARAGDTKRLGLGLRLPAFLARALHPRSRKLMGVNFSLPRAAFFEVNGYDETWTLYGREDLDLELRLRRAGWSFYPLLNRAIVFHLHHAERARSAEADRLVREQCASKRVRCEVGLDSTTPWDPAG